MEIMLRLFGMKQMEDRAKLLDQRKWSTMERMCIPRNRALGHEQLMQDYFAETGTAHSEYSVLRGGDTGTASSDEFSAGGKWMQGPLLAFYGAKK
jgi:hypothetical protein